MATPTSTYTASELLALQNVTYLSQSPIEAPLTARVMRSSGWMLLNSGAIKVMTFITQVVLSSILSHSDFGIYAIAISVSALVTNFRGGGMLQWMIQGGTKEYDRRASPTFWTSLLFNVLLGLVIVGLAVPAGVFYGNSQVTLILLISGVSFPLLTFGAFNVASMTMDLRMREATSIEVVTAFVRGALMIVFALSGLGPLSFVLPLPISYLIEAIMGYAYTKDKAWMRHAEVRNSHHLVWRNRWIMAGTLIITISLQADYFVLGKIVSLAVLGVYYFAYQMTYMSASLVTENARRVLTPGLVATPPERRAGASLRAASTLMVLGSPLLMMFACAIEPLQILIWHGKWSDAVLPIQLLSLGLPLQLLTTITQASLQGEGRFRLWAMVNSIKASCVIGGAVLGGILFPGSIARICIVLTIAFAVANGSQVVIVFRRQGVQLGRLLRSASSGLILAPIALATTLICASRVQLEPVLGVVFGCAMYIAIYLPLALLFSRHELSSVARTIRVTFSG